METLSLYQLNEFIRRVLALNFQKEVCIEAEIAQIKKSGGHYYLELVQKDEEGSNIIAQQSAVLWAGDYNQLKIKYGPTLDPLLQAGLTLKMDVRVDFHERYGLKLIIKAIDPTFTMGKLALAQQAVLLQLQSENLLLPNKLLALPLVVQRLAIVSSRTAAGFADLMGQLSENPYQYVFEVSLFESAVQGPNAPSEIAAALTLISERSLEFDAVLLVRGGGARLDLRCFDDYEVCAAIAHCKLPVIIGVGHVTDQVLADAVAHTQLKTPTAVAEWCIHHNAQFEYKLQACSETIRDLALLKVDTAQQRLQYLGTQLQSASKLLLTLAQQRIATLQDVLQIRALASIEKARTRLDFQAQFLHQSDPAQLLAKGFTITLLNGASISAQTMPQKGDTLQTLWAGGTLESEITK